MVIKTSNKTIVYPNFDSGRYLGTFTIHSNFFQMIPKDTDKQMFAELEINIAALVDSTLKKYDKIRFAPRQCLYCFHWKNHTCLNIKSEMFNSKTEGNSICENGYEETEY